MLQMAMPIIHRDLIFQSNLSFKLSLSRLGAVTLERRLIVHRYYSPAFIALRVMFIRGSPETPIDPAPVLLFGI